MLVSRLRRRASIKPTSVRASCFLGETRRSQAVADPECARGRGLSHILAEKGLLAQDPPLVKR